MTQRIEPVGPREGVAPVELRILSPVERELERERRERRRRERRRRERRRREAAASGGPAKRAQAPSEPPPERGGLDIRA